MPQRDEASAVGSDPIELPTDGVYTEPPPSDPIVSVVMRSMEWNRAEATVIIRVLYLRKSGEPAHEETFQLRGPDQDKFKELMFPNADIAKATIAALVKLGHLANVEPMPPK